MKKNKVRIELEGLAKEGKLFCKKYKREVDLKRLYGHKCYIQPNRRGYCKYVIIK